MPEADYVWLPRTELLTFEELGRIVDAFIDRGVTRVRITGGEPLLRRGLPELVAMLAARPALRDIALTTNGVRLAAHAHALREAGLRRVTVSVDTLRAETFRTLTRSADHAAALEGIAAARRVGLPVKLNTVVIRGVNDDELPDLLAFAEQHAAEVRFIEYMDVGGATHWSADAVVPREEILARITAARGPVTPLAGRAHAPAERFQLGDGMRFGVIASTTAPFCGTCDRSRLTADGAWFTCLYATRGIDLKGPVRGGATGAQLAALIHARWASRDDRGAELRRAEAIRGPLHSLPMLRKNVHLEMHTRGG